MRGSSYAVILAVHYNTFFMFEPDPSSLCSLSFSLWEKREISQCTLSLSLSLPGSKFFTLEAEEVSLARR
jgi:hypothetical protein